MSDNSETRTEQGYAMWKEDPQSVKMARAMAQINIGMKQLEVTLVDLYRPVLDAMAKRLP